MNACPEYRETILSHALGVIEADTARRVREHLQGCAACREFASSASALCGNVAKTAAELRVPVPPAGFHARLARRIHADAKRPQSSLVSRIAQWFTLPRIGFAAACGVLMLTAIMLLNRDRSASPVVNSAPLPKGDDGPLTLLAYQRAFNESFEQFDALSLRDDNRLAKDGGWQRRFGNEMQF